MPNRALPEPIRVPLRGSAGDITFESFSDVADFAKRELETWSPLERYEPRNARERNTIKLQLQPARTLLRLASEVTQSPDPTHDRDLQTLADQIKQTMRHYVTQESIHSTHDLAGELRVQLEEDPSGTVERLGVILDATEDEDRNRTPRVRGVPASIEQIRAAASEAAEKARKDAYQINELQQQLLAQTTQIVAKVQADADRDTGLRGAALEAQAKAHREKLDSLESSFRDEQALRRSRETWNQKRDGHAATRLIALGAFLLLAAAGAFLFWRFGLPEIGRAFDDESAGTTRLIADRLSLFLEIGIPGGIIVWLMRVAARVFFAESALANDARERAAMSEALVTLATESDVTTEQRSIIYRALFRPVGTPRVDDASPYQAAESVIAAATKSNEG